MTDDNQDALRCAVELENDKECSFTQQEWNEKTAAHIRRLVAENEAKDALLRQAVEALERAEQLIASEWGEPDPLDKSILTINAIREHLKGSA